MGEWVGPDADRRWAFRSRESCREAVLGSLWAMAEQKLRVEALLQTRLARRLLDVPQKAVERRGVEPLKSLRVGRLLPEGESESVRAPLSLVRPGRVA